MLKNSWKFFLSGFLQALEINNYSRTIISNTCELINVSGDILNAGGNVADKENYGFTCFFQKSLIIIDDKTKMPLMNMNRNPKPNIDEQQFKNLTSENIDKKD